MVTVNPVAQQQWDDQQGCAALVQHWGASPAKQVAERLVGDMVARVQQLAERPLHIADVGCGSGRLVPQVLPTVAKYTGYDTCRGLLQQARAAYGTDKRTAFVERDLFAGAPYKKPVDLVLSIDTSRHYDDPLGLLLAVRSGWPAARYLFSVLHGSQHVELLNGVCLSTAELEAGLPAMGRVEQWVKQEDPEWQMTISYITLVAA